jgi:hypothetical protein
MRERETFITELGEGRKRIGAYFLYCHRFFLLWVGFIRATVLQPLYLVCPLGQGVDGCSAAAARQMQLSDAQPGVVAVLLLINVSAV